MRTVTLYTNSSDRKVVNKNLEKIYSVKCRLKEPCSILRPVVILTRSLVGAQWASANYAYIPAFNRYYFIDNITVLNGGLIQVEMSVDVLMTYAGNILDSQQEVVRSESLNSKMYIDTEMPLQANKIITPVIIGGFPDSSGNNYYLTVAGGT